MNAEVHLDPFAAPPAPSLSQQDLEVAWFDAPRRSSRPLFPCSPASTPPPPIDDPLADPWFR
jgi:hypothetical protein